MKPRKKREGTIGWPLTRSRTWRLVPSLFNYPLVILALNSFPRGAPVENIKLENVTSRSFRSLERFPVGLRDLVAGTSISRRRPLV